MNPVRTFDQITQEILDKYDYKTITVGILIADGNQTAARDYIINYMDKFDKESGKYIDFFVPGYCERISNSTVSIEKRYHPNAYEKWICMGDLPMFIIRRNQTAYYFDKFLFDDFIEEMKTKIPHGQSNQLMFKDVMKMYKKIKPTGRINDLEAVIAESLSVAPENALEELYALMDKVLKSAPLEEFGVKKSDLSIFAGDVIKTQQRLLRNNYVQLSEEQILEIYEAAY